MPDMTPTIFYIFPVHRVVELKNVSECCSHLNGTIIIVADYLLQMICCEQICNVSRVPSSCVICVRNTIRQRVDFFLLRGPAVWSGKRCSTSTFRSCNQFESGLNDFGVSSWKTLSQLPSKCQRNHMSQSYPFRASNRFRWEWFLRFSSHCMASNFCPTLCMPDKTCAVPHGPHQCQWKSVASSACRSRSIWQWEIHFHCDL